MFYAMIDGAPALALKTGNRAACPGCSGEVIAKCGAVVMNHWAHKTDDCGFESSEHLTLKLLFAYPSGGVEVHNAKINRRADVVVGRSVFEIQRSKIDPQEAAARDVDWEGEGYCVYWVIVDGFDVTVPSKQAVTARMLPDGRVEMWCPGIERETFNPYKSGMAASSMAMNMLARRTVARAADLAMKLEDVAREQGGAADAAAAARDLAVEQARRAKEDAAATMRQRNDADADIRQAARDRKQAAHDRAESERLSGAGEERRRIQEMRQLAEWIQERTGLRNLRMLRRIAKADPAAAAVVAAIDEGTEAAVREARGATSAEAVCKRLKDLCSVWVGVGLHGKVYACEICTGEESVHDTIEKAVLWCVRAIPRHAALEAA
jgi:predicted RNA-binding Zn-ribbon protein involved in translation (DUF1610 family)